MPHNPGDRSFATRTINSQHETFGFLYANAYLAGQQAIISAIDRQTQMTEEKMDAETRRECRRVGRCQK